MAAIPSLCIGFVFLCNSFIIDGVSAAALENGDDSSGSNAFLSSAQLIIVSFGVTCCLILVVAGCSWAWWVRICRRLRGEEVTTNGYVVGPGNNPVTQLGVQYPPFPRGSIGSNGAVTIEPLPAVHDFQIDGRSSFELRTRRIPSIISLTEEDHYTNTNDWFDPGRQNFHRGNVEYLKVVGKGWFGQVIEAEARNIVPYRAKISVCVKLLREDSSDDEQRRFLNEARMYRDSNHENILKMLGHCIEASPYILIMQYWPLGDLKSHLLANKARSEDLFRRGILMKMAMSIANGLEWMEVAGFVHGDLAARNCMVTAADGSVVIGDYGLGTQNFREDYFWSGNVAIPLRWAAPETISVTSSEIKTLKATHKSNIWTMGVILWEIFEFGKSPYFELSDEDVLNRVIEGRNYILERPIMEYATTAIKNKLYNIMLISCWQSNPATRASITDIVHSISTLQETTIF